nr:hypothetical protein L203_03961 [Cryptococcus depauperatus CBS 7841]
MFSASQSSTGTSSPSDDFYVPDREEYPLAAHFWGSPEIVAVHSDHGTRIAMFPLEFIRKGGDNTWSYVLYVVCQLIVLEPGQSCQLQNEDGIELDLNEAPEAGSFRLVLEPGQSCQLQNEDGIELDLNEAPEAGSFRLHVEGSQSGVTFSHGPEYFSRFKAPNPHGSISTRSNSRRSSINQSNFREAIIARDGVCIVSDVYWQVCTSAHIAPYSRPDLYEHFYKDRGELQMFHPSVGLLLRDDLHHAFDRLMMSLYEKDETLYVHFFHPVYSGKNDWHGKAIPPDFFRGPPEDRPDPTLLHWHYSQCVKARIRGFAVGML